MPSYGHGARNPTKHKERVQSRCPVTSWRTAAQRGIFQEQSLIVAPGKWFLSGERSRWSLLPCAPFPPLFSCLLLTLLLQASLPPTQTPTQADEILSRVAGGLTIHVAPGGDDHWSGALTRPNAARTDGPLATLQGARDRVRDSPARAEDSVRADHRPVRGGNLPGERTCRLRAGRWRHCELPRWSTRPSREPGRSSTAAVRSRASRAGPTGSGPRRFPMSRPAAGPSSNSS